MSESKLRTLSMDFAVDIVNLVRDLRSKHETVIANQIGRSGALFLMQGVGVGEIDVEQEVDCIVHIYLAQAVEVCGLIDGVT